MNRKNFSLFLLLAALFASLCPLSIAADLQRPSREETDQMLEANRRMLARYQENYSRLKREQAGPPSIMVQRELDGLEIKIKALKDDSLRLQKSLPENQQVNELLKDLMTEKNRKEKLKKETGGMSPELLAKIYALHEKALKHTEKKQFESAARVYEEIVLLDPEDDEAYLIMGHNYLLAGQYDKADAAFHNAVDIRAENFDEILPFYQNIVMQNPDDDRAYSNLGYAYLILGDGIRARQAFRDALAIAADNADAARGLSIIEKGL